MSEKTAEKLAENFLFSDMDTNDQSLSVFDKQTTNNDGIYRPNLKDAKDQKLGYKATIRFIKNFITPTQIGPSAIEKHIHYVDMKNNPNVSGYYDCKKNNDPTCELCTEYWKLKNSKNAADNEKAELLKRTTKYYSYIMVIEDEQHPELVGKILVYPYGYTIKEKINSERNGEVTGEPCDIFHIEGGKDFRLIIKEKAGFQNYDASQFLSENGKGTPIKLYDEKSEKFKTAPVNENGKINNPKVIQKIMDVIFYTRTVTLEDHKAKDWSEQTEGKVNDILSILAGKEVYVAQQKAQTSKRDNTSTNEEVSPVENDATDADDFFSLED